MPQPPNALSRQENPMKRILIAILTALTLLAGWTPAADAADRTPLLMEGKKTLYQRVITHPGASLYAGQG